ncbi:MAG: DegT/DnrJ/EryC1/StrS family aminotransferase, partial [Candidatus Cloacimonetes bacterium]|nr:DegT/DnrJ/EryC1/StrS family aminotransferase [Candidatus Cloacimonadota bacterium]
LRHHGENPRYYHKWVGLNSRLDTLQAAVLLVKLAYLEGWSAARQANALYYYQHLADIPQIELPYIHPKAGSIFNQFTLRARYRDELVNYLIEKEVGSAIYYPQPLHIQECFSYLGYRMGDFPLAEEASRLVISIPVFSELTREQQDYVISCLREFYARKISED